MRYEMSTKPNPQIKRAKLSWVGRSHVRNHIDRKLKKKKKPHIGSYKGPCLELSSQSNQSNREYPTECCVRLVLYCDLIFYYYRLNSLL